LTGLVSNEENALAITTMATKCWSEQLIERLNASNFDERKPVLLCAPHFNLKNILMDMRRFRPLSALAAMIKTASDGSIKVDKAVRIDKNTSKKDKILYTIGLYKIGGIISCFCWDRCQVKLCKNPKTGKFMVLKTDNEAVLFEVIEQLMGSYFKSAKRQETDEPIMLSNTGYVNVPGEADRLKRFMQKFFVLEKEDNTQNLANNLLTNPTVLRPMTVEKFDEIFKTGDKNVSDSVNFIVAQVFKNVEEQQNKREILSFDSETVIRESNFVLNMEPQMFIYLNNV